MYIINTKVKVCNQENVVKALKVKKNVSNIEFKNNKKEKQQIFKLKCFT